LWATLDTIEKTGTAPEGYKGGGNFENDGRNNGQILPTQDANGNPIKYKEWDVNPFTSPQERGQERLVTGSDGSAYYTNNHYQTFTKVK
jgi:guanyl-specific ribonuclease Sa